MSKFSILRIISLITVLGLNGCKSVEDAPPVDLCQYNGTPRAFYCKNTSDGKKTKIPADSLSMKAAQCLSADDYKTMQAYVDYLLKEAEKRCN